MAQIAFIGLGNMGGPMARNLLAAGHGVAVFDLNEAALAGMAEAGARVAGSSRVAVEGAEVVITMLPAGAHVEAVYLASEDQACLLDQLPTGTLLLDCSTIAAETARSLAAAAAQRGLAMLDAPVSGGVGGAEAGTLTFMVGAMAPRWIVHARCWKPWEKTSFTPGRRGPARSPRCAITCSSPCS